LFPGRSETRQIMENTFLFSEFLAEQADYHPPLLNGSAVLHGHCHHQALMRGAPHQQRLLERMQLNVHVLAGGCCGMAGAFGFEAGKYDISAKIGEHGLLPAVREARPTELIVADGFSCREQIAQLTQRQALHTAEVLQLALHPELAGEPQLESALVRQNNRALRHSKLRALAVLAAVAAGGFALAGILRNNNKP